MLALDVVAVRAWAAACVRSLSALRADIDGINVYPVADSDTGSNLLHTLTAANTALARAQGVESAGAALRVLAGGAVAEARGNSGVIMSQVLRGFAESAGEVAEVDGVRLADALRAADRLATSAVARPVAGTMLSVLHAVAAAAGEGTVTEVATSAAATAAGALEETPHQLAVLARAGVVDAGGRGLVAVLDALVGVVTGVEHQPGHAVQAHAPSSPKPVAWEVMYLLADAREDALPSLRKALSGLGDSVTVAGDGGGNHAVHVHCADIGAALEAGLLHGRPHSVRVEPLMTPAPEDTALAAGERAVVAVVHGDGVADLIDGEGGDGVAVLRLAAGERPEAEELIGLITETAASHVTVLPGGVELTAAAERIAGHPTLDGKDVVVVPCASPVQVLSALAVHDPGRKAGADVVAMAEAAAATRRGDLVVAQEESITWVGRAQAGDLVGLVDGEVVLIERATRVAEAAGTVLERMLAVGGELVTLLTGAGAPAGIEESVAAHLRAVHPEVELVCYSGGQTDALLLMGVE
ncbi:DAK2 domain-containing protein [Saccharomonospora sp. NPDC006951]